MKRFVCPPENTIFLRFTQEQQAVLCSKNVGVLLDFILGYV